MRWERAKIYPIHTTKKNPPAGIMAKSSIAGKWGRGERGQGETKQFKTETRNRKRRPHLPQVRGSCARHHKDNNGWGLVRANRHPRAGGELRSQSGTENDSVTVYRPCFPLSVSQRRRPSIALSILGQKASGLVTFCCRCSHLQCIRSMERSPCATADLVTALWAAVRFRHSYRLVLIWHDWIGRSDSCALASWQPIRRPHFIRYDRFNGHRPLCGLPLREMRRRKRRRERGKRRKKEEKKR